MGKCLCSLSLHRKEAECVILYEGMMQIDRCMRREDLLIPTCRMFLLSKIPISYTTIYM